MTVERGRKRQRSPGGWHHAGQAHDDSPQHGEREGQGRWGRETETQRTKRGKTQGGDLRTRGPEGFVFLVSLPLTCRGRVADQIRNHCLAAALGNPLGVSEMPDRVFARGRSGPPTSPFPPTSQSTVGPLPLAPGSISVPRPGHVPCGCGMLALKVHDQPSQGLGPGDFVLQPGQFQAN